MEYPNPDDGPDRKENNAAFFKRLMEKAPGFGATHPISPDENLSYEDRIFIAKKWTRSHNYNTREKEYICEVAEFPELRVIVREFHEIEKAVNEELLRLRDKRIRESNPIPEPEGDGQSLA